MRSLPLCLSFATVLFVCMAHVNAEAADTLAIELAQEQDHEAAALEFRRLALASEDTTAQAGYYWMAGHQYMLSGDNERSNDMLDQAEMDDIDLVEPASLIRSENALDQRNPDQTSFYLESLLSAKGDISKYASRRLVGIKLRSGDLDGAESLLAKSFPAQDAGIAAIDSYRQGHDKSPVAGGLLGLIPGVGHAYSGEYANGLRCLIMNALFIYGMVDTADDDQWGAFAVITFFELTWYSGSIYGGMDAAHRYNRNRLDDCVGAVEGGMDYNPDWKMLPTIRLEFSF